MIRDAELAQDALQLEALVFSRAYGYALFAKMLGGAPDDDLLDALFDDATFDVFDEFGAQSGELKAFCALLESKREERAADAAAFLDRASDEYTRVFVGPLALPASPYESPYTGAHDMALFQENTLAVRALYHGQGLRVRRELVFGAVLAFAGGIGGFITASTKLYWTAAKIVFVLLALAVIASRYGFYMTSVI